MKEIGVTLDAIAMLRESRGAKDPDPVMAAFIAEQAGAAAINVRLRSDRRHIQERDVKILRETVVSELNLWTAPSQEMAGIVLTVKPDRVTFVPERIDAAAAGSLDVILNTSQLRQFVKMMKESSIQASVFIEPDLDQVKASHQVDMVSVELNAEAFVTARDRETADREHQRLSDCARLAEKLGLMVSVSHGLTLRNCPPLLRMRGVRRLNVGHSLMARAMMVGIEQAAREWTDLARGLATQD